MSAPRTMTQFGSPGPGALRALAAAFETVGFRPRSSGLRRGALEVTPEASWLTFTAQSPGTKSRRRRARKAAPVAATCTFPGLWKKVATSGRSAPSLELHLPTAVVLPPDEGPDDGDLAGRVAAVVEWVELTARGRTPADWTAPPAEILAAGAPTERLHAQSGRFVVRGHLVVESGRFAVVFPLGPKSPPMDPSRRRWLAALLADAQDRWRMVRFRSLPGDVAGDDGFELVAEADLTGAPHDIIEAVLPIAVDALREVVARLLTNVRFLTDPRAQCAVWDFSPPRARPQKGTS